MAVDPASFRDPAGHIHHINGRIYRSIEQVGLADYLFVRESGALLPLIAEGSVLDGKETAPDVLGEFSPVDGVVIEHPRIPFWSYPYEWSFGALKAAALLHLDLQMKLLSQGIALSDASAYNIQFLGSRPIFIDILSFRRYRRNEHWLGHHQFCEQYLNPLLLQSYFGIPFNDWYRGRLEGVPTETIARLVRWRHLLSWRMLGHVVLPSRLGSSRGDGSLRAASKARARGLPRSSYLALLAQLRSWIAKLSAGGVDKTVWRTYASDNTYVSEEAEAKRAFIADFARSVRPTLMLDLGCNTGDYAELALESGARSVVGLDGDHGAIEQAFDRATAKRLNFLPLYQDVANPSPGQGWNQIERKGLAERCREIDAVIALAFEHHLAIGRNIPLAEVVRWITDLAPQGVIEFVHKSDPTIRKMLALRDDIFSSYTNDAFLAALKGCARIVRRQQVSASGRELFWFERHR